MEHRATTIRTLLDALLADYPERVPDLAAVLKLLHDEGAIESFPGCQGRSSDALKRTNAHEAWRLDGHGVGESAVTSPLLDSLALRTFKRPGSGIAETAAPFEELGYTAGERRDFPERSVAARWYNAPSEDLPHLFLSELQVERLSPAARGIIFAYADEPYPVAYAEYQRLLTESEYGAWLLVNPCRVIHLTLAVHRFSMMNTLPTCAAFLQRNGFHFHGEPDNVIRTDGDGALSQCSLLPRALPTTFAHDERHEVLGPYLAFAQRHERGGFTV